MRIAIVTRRVGCNDGQGRVNLEIAAEALRQGHAVHLYSEHVDAPLIQAGAVPFLVPPTSFLSVRIVQDQIFAWRTFWHLARNAASYDAVLTCGFATWASASVNAVHFVHRSWLRSPYHPWRVRRTPRSFYAWMFSYLNRHLERDAFARSDSIVAVSARVRQELLEVGVPAARITTILNGVDSAEFHPGPPRRAAFGLPEDVPLAVFAGDLKSPRKNLETVLRALPGVPGLHLAVAGRHEGTPWPAVAAELGVADRVHFLGFQTDMPGLMRAADLLTFPSRYEPFGLVFLEAMASGLPVVTAASAGGAELITPDVGVVLEDCDDAAALAAALRDLLAQPERRRAMGVAARDLALKYTWPAMARQYLDLLRRAAAGRQAAVTAPASDSAHA